MEYDVMFGDKTEIIDRNGKSFRLVGFLKPNALHCWVENGLHCAKQVRVKASEFPIEQLQEGKVWGKLSKDLQKTIEAYEENYKSQMHEKMDHARKSRKSNPAYEDMPDELVCKCAL